MVLVTVLLVFLLVMVALGPNLDLQPVKRNKIPLC